ncbi:GNAT family N-acetyltransferase [Streptomyces roseoverticillatus]|uniref:GNAT family N-acetyltransferase n=1 Tax=Streptomyces roseoverticillatus TaxID=66429 RepID=UPI0027E4BDE3|nr:GNAT family N-acetyltransferase [Streptomyces roseoverticillatus]MCF3102210.1 GNAT family N-acetyltransferase [Streptomyces roseoverticillatus]
MINIRTLSPDDWPLWRELRLAALAEAPYAFGSRLADWQGDGDREERWRARLALPGSFNLIAERGAKPVGMVSGIPGPNAGTVELISLWVAANARGRGVGECLVQAVEQWATGMGTERLHLAVMPGNEHAFALYRRLGLRDTGPHGDPLPDGRREHVMVKHLPTDRNTHRADVRRAAAEQAAIWHELLERLK